MVVGDLALDATWREHGKELAKKRKRRRLQPHQATAALDRLELTTGPEGFGRCELVVEAVAERLDIKQAVFRELAELMGPDAILATNTSSLSVDAIAEGLPNPERVVGMHFFNPVKRMPLVEIVRGKLTSDEVVARVSRLALDLGKTPVVTADVAGFLVNRVLGPYLDEAIRLFESGSAPAELDRLIRRFLLRRFLRSRGRVHGRRCVRGVVGEERGTGRRDRSGPEETAHAGCYGLWREP